MSVKSITAMLVLAAAVAAAPAGARPAHDDRKIHVRIMDLQFGPPTAACAAGTATYSLVFLDGAPAGTGTGCLTSDVSQCPVTPVVGCRDTVLSTLTFTFTGKGSVTAPSTFKQVQVSDTAIEFRATGKITQGTGEFAGARGEMKGSGTIDFAAPQPDATWVVDVHQAGHDDDD
jgi:hypothetical protein